jgi:hypothetical protein
MYKYKYTIDLHTLPSTVLEQKHNLSIYNIKPKSEPDTLDAERPIEVEFPVGWTFKARRSDDFQSCTYYDQDGVARIVIYAKLTSYRCWTEIMFIDDATSMKIKIADDEERQATEERQNFILLNFTEKWSEENRYIVYYFIDGAERAFKYFEGYPCPTMDQIDEFSLYRFIGYCRGPNDMLVDKLRGYSKECIVFRELPHGPINLRRFEVRELLGYDPNLKGEGLERHYDGSYVPIRCAHTVYKYNKIQ